MNKRDDLLLRIPGNDPDVIMITEVLTKVQTSFISDVQLQISGYNPFTNFELSWHLSGTNSRALLYITFILRT